MQQLQDSTTTDHIEGCSNQILQSIGDHITPLQSVGDQIALVDSDGSWTDGRLADATGAIESWLLYLGIRSGDRVMIVSAHCRAFVAILLALVRIEAWPVLVDANLSAHEVDRLRAQCEPRRVFYMVSASQLARMHAIRHNAEFIDPVEWGPVAFSEINDGAEREF